MAIAVADALSHDMLDADRSDGCLVPVLHRAGGEGNNDAPLLPPEQQRIFGETEFHRFTEARSMYALGG